MSSAWGLSFGNAWGNAWGLISEQLQPTGAGKNKKSRVIIGEKEYFLTPFETADLLIQRAKNRKAQQVNSDSITETENVSVIANSYDKIVSDNQKLFKPANIVSQEFDIQAAINANHAFIARLRESLYRLELEAIQRREEDDEECLMLLL